MNNWAVSTAGLLGVMLELSLCSCIFFLVMGPVPLVLSPSGNFSLGVGHYTLHICGFNFCCHSLERVESVLGVQFTYL